MSWNWTNGIWCLSGPDKIHQHLRWENISLEMVTRQNRVGAKDTYYDWSEIHEWKTLAFFIFFCAHFVEFTKEPHCKGHRPSPLHVMTNLIIFIIYVLYCCLIPE